jgi:pSer/pThr/pTyr-binding forkhead associated (FHA) protein
MICPRCNYKNPDGSLSCNLCGELLKKKGDAPPRPTAEQIVQHEALSKTELAPVRKTTLLKSRQGKEAKLSEDMEIVLSEGGESGDLRFWLYCFPLEPVELTKDRSFTLGRGKTNDLVLPVGAVSRTHSRISWNGRAFEIVDLDSLNGTYVNGHKADRHVLKAGDMIGIGPYDVEVRAARGILENLKAMMNSGESTQILDKDNVFKADSTLAGKIGDVRLGEVFHMVEFNRKTGTLEVLDGDRRGEFRFREGQILDAAFEASRGIEAVAHVLRLETGTFVFEAGEPACEQTIHEPTVKVLLDASRFLDENPETSA